MLQERYMRLKEHAHDIIKAAIHCVKPEQLFRDQVTLNNSVLTIRNKEFSLDKFEHIYIVGAGKASAFMAEALEKKLGNRINGGGLVVKYGHGAPVQKVKIFEGGHPIIDENSLRGTTHILEIVDRVSENDLVICLLSGGGSALLEKLPSGITLTDLQETFRLLLECGAAIEEINTVRKHLSEVKGGQLARRISPGTCITLIISDVIGDPVESIASGPTSADPSTFKGAWEVISKYKLQDSLPDAISGFLQKGVNGNLQETLKPGDSIFEKVHNIILGNNLLSLLEAEKSASKLGFNTLILSSQIQGEAREVAKAFAGIVQETLSTGHPLAKPACLIMGGETTVTIRDKGKGGRNQELALASLIALKNIDTEYVLISCGSDGTDGPTDAAGGIASPEIWKGAKELGLNAQAYLDRNDAYNFFRQVDGLITTGPTGTNVMDIMMALIA
jgi:glycerate-2-kinase